MTRKGKIFIGTSGWHYKHWIGPWYPAGTKESDQLAFYQDHFSTVEINNSFYHLPLAKTFTAWRKLAPKGFIYAVKASRFITHMKKLKVDKKTINKFINRVKRLKEKTGPILFQLPPGWKLNTERLQKFLKKLPTEYRYAFEFRNATWYDENVYDALRQYNCAFCIYELAGHMSPKIVTADYVYIRLHGPGNKYQGSYSTDALKKWAKDIKEWTREGKDVYVYFDNDQAGYAAFNAATLADLTA